MKDQLKKKVLLYLKALETGDLSILDDIIHPDYFLIPSEMAQTTKQIVTELGKNSNIIGIEGLKMRLARFKEVWQHREITIQDIVADETTVMLSFNLAYTFTGILLGIKSTEKRIHTRGYYTFKFRDGKIINAHMLDDFFDVIRQLGLSIYETEENIVQEYLDAVRKNMPFEL